MSRSYLITEHNIELNPMCIWSKFEFNGAQYLCGQKEIGDETNKVHY